MLAELPQQTLTEPAAKPLRKLSLTKAQEKLLSGKYLNRQRVLTLSSFDWLVRLRWLAILGQITALSLASGWLNLPLRLPPLIAVFLLTSVSNVLLPKLPQTLREKEICLQGILLLDVILLTLLLGFSGGPENPFSIIYLLHVVLSAVLLDRKKAMFMAGFSISLYGLLFFWSSASSEHSSAHAHHQMVDGQLNTHLLGMWGAFALVSLITAYCVTMISEELRKKELETETLKLKQKQLASLTTLSAGAAHELSTPLGTIALAVGELSLQLKNGRPLAALEEDLDLISSQTERCKQIISRMSACSGELAGEMPKRMTLRAFGDNLSNMLQIRFLRRFPIHIDLPDAQIIVAEHALFEALSALVKNALEASLDSSAVALSLLIHHGNLTVEIQDEGEGMDKHTQDHLGEPFYSTKAEGKGMGLGVYLARLTAENFGGKLHFESEKGVGTRATFSVAVSADKQRT